MNRDQLRAGITKILHNATSALEGERNTRGLLKQTGHSSITIKDINSILYSETTKCRSTGYRIPLDN